MNPRGMKPPLFPKPRNLIETQAIEFAADWIEFDSVRDACGKSYTIQHRRERPLRFWKEAVGEEWLSYIETEIGMVQVEAETWSRVRNEVKQRTT